MSLDLSCFIYSSRLAPGYNFGCISDIIKTSRIFNQAHDITGVLIFNGQRFYQYIEGPTRDLYHLIERIQADPRHTDFTPRYQSFLNDDRLFTNWTMAYAFVEEVDPFDALDKAKDRDLVQLIRSLLPILDIT